MKHLIIYHKADNDGLFSMAIIWNYLHLEKHIPASDIPTFAADYDNLSEVLANGQLESTLRGIDAVYITDVSFNEQPFMLELYKRYGENFFWFDHHAPIIDYSMTNDLHKANGLRDISHSALYNAYKYFYPNTTVPEILRILSAFDSFTFMQEGYDKDFVFNVNQGVTNTYKLNPNEIISLTRDILYNRFDNSKITEYKKVGEDFMNYQYARYAETIEKFGDFTFTVNNESACALFLQEQTSSEIFKSVKDKAQHGIVFKHLPNGNWVLSLYNTDPDNSKFHCGNYCKSHFNGGGHPGAAGATLSLDQFIEILKTKKL